MGRVAEASGVGGEWVRRGLPDPTGLGGGGTRGVDGVGSHCSGNSVSIQHRNSKSRFSNLR